MKKIFLILFLLPLCCLSQTVEGFQINHNFTNTDGSVQKGLYCTVQIKTEIKFTSDSGMIVTRNRLYANKDIADVFPDSNLIVGKQILADYMLYSLPSSETTYWYGKHIGTKLPVEAVIEEIILFNYSIPEGIRKSEIIKTK